MLSVRSEINQYLVEIVTGTGWEVSPLSLAQTPVLARLKSDAASLMEAKLGPQSICHQLLFRDAGLGLARGYFVKQVLFRGTLLQPSPTQSTHFMLISRCQLGNVFSARLI